MFPSFIWTPSWRKVPALSQTFDFDSLNLVYGKSSKQRPQTDIRNYGIKFDRSIFHVNGVPTFSLKCLAYRHIFERLSGDSYGDKACTGDHLPLEDKYF